MWQTSQLTWPISAQTIQTSAEAVTNQVSTVMNEAVGRLTALNSDANFGRHSLSAEAQALLGLRGDLQSLLNHGTVLTVSPYQFQVGSKLDSGAYLNPQTAVKTLANKLRDLSDTNRPKGQLYAVAIMLTASSMTSFASQLTELVSVFNLPDWCQVARQAQAMTTNERDKFQQPAAIVQPRFKPAANINASPLRDYLALQGSQIATLESLASDSTNVIGKLSALAAKRSEKLSEVSAQINALKQLKGSVYSFALSGTPESIATQLVQAGAPNNHQHTLASVMLSDRHLAFFQELLCSH
ncbi:hypothetical protein [Vibrio aestuarianus]|uniref:hypothetical protein n=1 Tax=Vibrio aestuarianus TaxID=28171 RepID=UPI001593E5B2|nr:hypothetical protein [Vibrio aestuarianus]MDE1235767.1 hypothetical protein [Vibrio aestuarianus]MDE1246677.1 hypothetical protein [Vibrio aestuarianus]MDE1316356.1 hypothetical protein [Vibrio aestuarianus]NGZ63760.1 hypothetical protein [Vibrio aestuarianus subsp. cardii]